MLKGCWAYFYVETLEDEFVLGLKTPVAKLVTKTGFTKALANVALETSERRVMTFQRFIKRSVEEQLFDNVVTQAGLDPQQAQVRLNWGLPEKPEIEALLPVLAQIATARPDVISTEEFRDILIDMGLPIRRQEVTALVTPTQTQPPQILGVSKPEQPIVSARKKHEVKPRMAGGSRFLLQASPDWCADAGGHWITYDGKHLCIDIQDYQKVPKEIHDEVAQGEREHRKATAKRAKTAKYRKRKKSAHKLTSDWSHRPKDRAHLGKRLQRYKSEYLERVGLEILQKPLENGDAAYYDSGVETIYVNPEYAYGESKIDWWIDHEMGHHVAKVTEGTVAPGWTRKYLTGENKSRFEEFLGDYAVSEPAELYSEAWQKMMLKPNKVKQRMKKDKVIKEFYTTLQERSGYSMKEIRKRKGE